MARPDGRSFPNAPFLAAQLHFTAFCGPVVRKDTARGAPTRLIDVAPTIPYLIGTPYTAQTEGLVALDALVEDDTVVGGSSRD